MGIAIESENGSGDHVDLDSGEVKTAMPGHSLDALSYNRQGVLGQVDQNRARLRQMSGEARHQGVVAEVRRSSQLDEAGLRLLVESRLERGDRPLLLLGVLLIGFAVTSVVGWIASRGRRETA